MVDVEQAHDKVFNSASQRLALVIVLLISYSLLPVVTFVVGVYYIFFDIAREIDQGPFLDAITEMATEPGRYIGVIHQMLLPVVAVVTVATYRTARTSRFAAWLFLIPLIALILSIVDGLMISSASILEGEEAAIVSQMYLNVAGNLAIYVMTLVGLRLSDLGEG